MDIETVKKFLVEFKIKAKTFGLRFRIDRQKNMQGLLDFEIQASEREQIVMDLEGEDYYKGPREDNQGDLEELWEFGKTVKQKEAYIKISKGLPGKNPVCVSFHKAERKINYPLKKKKL